MYEADDPSQGLCDCVVAELVKLPATDPLFSPENYDDNSEPCRGRIRWYKRNHSHVFISGALLSAVEAGIRGRLCLEVGSGAGSLAHLLQERGCCVIATDPIPITKSPGIRIVPQPELLDARQAAQMHNDAEVLLICCPLPALSGHTSYAAEALAATTANTVIFVGETDPSYMGCEEFYDLLRIGWNLEEISAIPTYPFENIRVYRFGRPGRARSDRRRGKRGR
jgi:hypothetical protein